MGMRIDDPVNRRFDILRKQAKQQTQGQAQQEQEAINRKFAGMGMLSSGEAVKQNQLATGRARAQETSALENIEGQRLGVLAQQQEAEKQRAFATGEREASQVFGRQERMSSQDFSRGQQDIQNLFQQKMLAKQQGFQADQANIDRAIQKKVFDTNEAFRQKTFSAQQSMAEFEKKMATNRWDMDQQVFEWNKNMAEREFNRKGMFEKLFTDPIGFYSDMGTNARSSLRSGNMPGPGGGFLGGITGGLF